MSRKITENLSKNGSQRCLTLKNGVQGLQKNKWRPFFWRSHHKNGRQKLHDHFLRKFGKIWAKNLLHQQTANKGYWQHCKFFRVPFVSLLILPHAFFRRGHVCVLLIITLFRHWTSYFLRLDKFENNFWLVLMAASASEMSQWAWVMVRMSMVINRVC